MELWDLYDSERRPLNRTHVRGEAFAEGARRDSTEPRPRGCSVPGEPPPAA